MTSNTRRTMALVAGLLFILAAAALAGDARSGASAPASGADAAKKVQTKCPIMGNPIDKSIFVDKDGKRIYVCCKMCPDKVKKDFDTYAKKLEAQGIDLTAPKDAAAPAAKAGVPVSSGDRCE